MDLVNDDFDFRGGGRLELGVAVLITGRALLASFVLTRPISAPQVAAAAAPEMPAVTESAQPGSTTTLRRLPAPTLANPGRRQADIQ